MMRGFKKKNRSVKPYTKQKTGGGFLSNIINRMPFEAHLPGYQYCGPGTKLKKRLRTGDPGINELDKACKSHDIAYDLFPGDRQRELADLALIDKAEKRMKSANASRGERLAASVVKGIMTVKNKIGGGLKSKVGERTKKIRKSMNKKSLNHNTLRSTVKKIGSVLSETHPKTIKDASRIALKAARKIIKNDANTRNNSSDFDRVIPVPKIGGILPLIPIFAGLSALGALAGGSAAVANAVVSANNAKKQLAESERHNKIMEAVAIGANKHGRGVYLKPYRSGLGLYMNKKKLKNSKN